MLMYVIKNRVPEIPRYKANAIYICELTEENSIIERLRYLSSIFYTVIYVPVVNLPITVNIPNVITLYNSTVELNNCIFYACQNDYITSMENKLTSEKSKHMYVIDPNNRATFQYINKEYLTKYYVSGIINAETVFRIPQGPFYDKISRNKNLEYLLSPNDNISIELLRIKMDGCNKELDESCEATRGYKGYTLLQHQLLAQIDAINALL